MRQSLVLVLVGAAVTSCMPKHFYAPYSAYLGERPDTLAATSRSSETGERYCGDLEKESNFWSTSHSTLTVGAVVLGVIAAGVGSGMVAYAANGTTVDRPLHTTGLGLQGAGALFAGLATFAGLRATAASRAAADAGNVASLPSTTSDRLRYQKCRAVLAAWEDRRDFVKDVVDKVPTITAAVNKFDTAAKKVEDTKLPDGGVVPGVEQLLKAKDDLLDAVRTVE